MNDYGDAWVCEDCYYAHHYGAQEYEGEWYSGDSDTPCDGEPLVLLAGCELADNVASEAEGMDSFSWQRCDGCGSTLGGARYRLAAWGRVR